jgi:hypothetical protein
MASKVRTKGRSSMDIFTRWLDLVARIGQLVGRDQREQDIPDDPLTT